ncbi:Uu.00g043430.m01.CDS01 [Anthostomella pinea]|uniref:Uu.00g043430.m01.CDS01 n=1 Tax=Anthostomella pinea TaxID=933095 RepID=A0AAI8VBQ3_9PEZI|nr:Uu.00g043430.m01.CDS01 [Anthostomella pinea]
MLDEFYLTGVGFVVARNRHGYSVTLNLNNIAATNPTMADDLVDWLQFTTIRMCAVIFFICRYCQPTVPMGFQWRWEHNPVCWVPQTETPEAGLLSQHVYFLRDGCAEGQFQQVIDRELKEIKVMFREANAPGPPKFTVIVAIKRHHIRFFPKPGDKATGDRNNNPTVRTAVCR